MENLEIVKASIHLPCMRDTFRNLIISTLVKNKEDAEIGDGESKIKEYHTDHSFWIFHQQENDIQLFCNACIQPVIPSSTPCYSCPLPQCSFHLHGPCANLRPTIKDFFWVSSLELFSKYSGFCSMFKCDMCGKESNGFGYKSALSIMDMECAASPYAIKHESHSQHLLALSTPTYPMKTFICCDLDDSFSAYSCRLCDHHIHAQCAFLPKTVTHKFDKHPLELIYKPTAQIPQEENIYLPSEVHDHPVTLTRMLTMGSQTCGFCKETIEGFVDNMDFHCALCDFWIHFECTRKKVRKWQRDRRFRR